MCSACAEDAGAAGGHFRVRACSWRIVGTGSCDFAVGNLIKVVPHAQPALWSRQMLHAAAGLVLLVPVWAVSSGCGFSSA